MELSEVRGAEENRVMKETMNEKDFIELMNKVKELDPGKISFYNLYPRIKRVGSRRRGHPLSGKPS